MTNRRHTETISAFDSLPTIARVPIQVVCGVTGRSRASVWRDVLAHRLPAPVKCGGSTRWVVGELRAALRTSNTKACIAAGLFNFWARLHGGDIPAGNCNPEKPALAGWHSLLLPAESALKSFPNSAPV